MKETLEAQAARDGLGDVVRLLGPKPQSKVRRRLAEARVFVLACAPEEGGGSDNLPTVIMEAMACGVPVVSTTLAGVPEMIVDGAEGFLVAPKNPPALAQALEKLLVDPGLAARLGGQGRASARARFAIGNTTRALKHLLVKCAGITPPAAARNADPELPAPSFLDRSRKIWR